MVRAAFRLAAGTCPLAAGGWMLRALHGAPDALGADPASIRAVAARFPELPRRRLRQPRPASVPQPGRRAITAVAGELVGQRGTSRPTGADSVGSAGRFIEGDASQLAVSWLGHSTVLVEIDGYRVLTDPVWSDRCSPSDVVGPQRLHPPPVLLEGTARARRGGYQP